MSDPILLFLTVNAAALLMLSIAAIVLPAAACSFLTTVLSGLGLLLCLPTLLMSAPETALDFPVGPPGLSLHFALDALSAAFLFITFLAGTALAAFQATTTPPTQPVPLQMTACCLAGAVISLLAADGVTLAIGLAVMCGATSLLQPNRGGYFMLLSPLLLLAAVCLLTPPGYAPDFDAIRAAPVGPNNATAAAALTFAAVFLLSCCNSGNRCWIRDALTAGILIPLGSYLLLRLIADLAGAAAQTGCGFVLLLAGGAIAIFQAWRAANDPDIDGSVSDMARRQAGLATAGIGLALIAHAADLPGAEASALAASLLSAISGSVAGILTTLSAHAIGKITGTNRLSSLGGLIHPMPATSVALAAGLLGLSALPPSLGFASLWLMFEAILSAPRTGGLQFQLPLALIAAALALSATLATAGSVRLIGVALLGRPRTPQGANAQESKSPPRTILLILAGVSVAMGVVPGPVLWLLADPAIQALTGANPDIHGGLGLRALSASSPSYLPLPVLALLVLATGAVVLVSRWSHRESKAAGPWADGMQLPPGLPFGEPAAQSTGKGFLPTLPVVPLPHLPNLRAYVPNRAPSAVTGLWLILVAFGALLLVLALLG